ncbi:hypothetical protein AB0M46_34930 [Dactylosporangium sp. NPDC051485]|uniref:hypothetical protein n=1 Tax=Dactylosporangium sp. NPDC051485 TaxID=3154846 RepID=UPI00344227FE
MSSAPTLLSAAGLTTAPTMVDQFRQLADADTTRIAVIDRDRTTTFGQLWRMAYQRVADRRASGTAVTPVVAMPTVGVIADALAVWLCDGVPLPIPFGLRAKTVSDAIAQTTTVAHWCRPWRAQLHTEYGGRHIWLAGGEPPTAPRVGDAIGLTTGGTALIAAPLHAAAIFEIAIRQLLVGGTVVLEPDFTPAGWLHTAAATHADWAVLAPGQIKALLQRERPPGWLGVATRALRRVVVPATITPPATNHLADFTAATDVIITTWYHAPAFDGAIATANRTAVALTALPGLRLRTVDPTGQPTPPGVAGLIEAASLAGCTTVGHRADQPCPQPMAWRTNGDIGTLTADGRLIVRKLEPAEHYLTPANERRRGTALHRALTAHPDIAAAAVHVVPDDHGRARAHIRVWPRPGIVPPLTSSAVAAHCTAADTAVSTHHILINSWPARNTPAAIR